MSRYVIGIDLGTTNCTLAYTERYPKEEHAISKIEQMPISQLISSDSIGEKLFLPSYIYFSMQNELQVKLNSHLGGSTSELCVGIFARDRGAELPGRVVASAKSWLCHAGIDRRASFLPLDNEGSLDKISPLDACALLLSHLKANWDQRMPNDPFKDQMILITVPASFDPSARQLVQEAAEKAGYPNVILLEEPQAAFYAWLHQHSQDWRKQLMVGDCILVVDIGGGTTDFSLISVVDNAGSLQLERLAVGSHLLLGGDNIDLSLAYLAKAKFENDGHELNEWQMQSLTHTCREIKELLLSDQAPLTADVVLHGRGSRLIGGTIKVALSQNEVKNLIMTGFIPKINPDQRSPIEKRSGIQQLGLPYAQDPRISCQLAKFLSMMGETESSSMERFIMPTAVLFNGGTLKAKSLQEMIVSQLNDWAKLFGKSPVKVLPGADYDFAVSRGAVYYALARDGKAVRIKGGTSRSYYIGVDEAAPAVPGLTPKTHAICVVPFGMEEGSEEVLKGQEFSLVIGELATFRFFSHSTPTLSNGVVATVGSVIKNWKKELTELHPIETLLEKEEGDGKVIRITLESRITELGFLELWCVAADGRKWKLEFDIREKEFLNASSS